MTTQTYPELLRQRFESFWTKTRGTKKAAHELQPQVYKTDSANRHWVTFQTAATPGYITLNSVD